MTSNWCTATYLGVNGLYSSHGDYYLGIATGGKPRSRQGHTADSSR